MQFDKTSLQRLEEARKILADFSTSELMTLYQLAMTSDPSYLQQRLREIETKWEIDPAENAFETNVIDPKLKSVLHNELLHALANEAGRNPEHYNALVTMIEPESPYLNEVKSELDGAANIPKWKPPTLGY